MSIIASQNFIHGRQQPSLGGLDFSLNNSNKSSLIPSLKGTLTTTTTQSDAFPVSDYQAVIVGISIGAVSGTTPTLTISVETSATATGSFVSLATSGNLTATGTYYFMVSIPPSASSQWYKIVLTLGGTTPSFVVNAVGAGQFFITNSGH